MQSSTRRAHWAPHPSGMKPVIFWTLAWPAGLAIGVLAANFIPPPPAVPAPDSAAEGWAWQRHSMGPSSYEARPERKLSSGRARAAHEAPAMAIR